VDRKLWSNRGTLTLGGERVRVVAVWRDLRRGRLGFVRETEVGASRGVRNAVVTPGADRPSWCVEEADLADFQSE
jgi:hypothetical protein